ncbi:MAG TPA: hypothetical protein VIJ49_10930 [Aestuariivirga sp.]
MKFLIVASVALFCSLSATPAIASHWGWKQSKPTPQQCMRMFKYYKNFRGPAAFATPDGLPVGQTIKCGQSEKPGANEAEDALAWCNNVSHSHSCKVIAQHK